MGKFIKISLLNLKIQIELVTEKRLAFQTLIPYFWCVKLDN